jgi:hypothetical protein
MSSSSAKPWVHHTVAVVATALTIWGFANVPAAASAKEPRSTDRRLKVLAPSFPDLIYSRAFEFLLGNIEVIIDLEHPRYFLDFFGNLSRCKADKFRRENMPVK